MTAKVSAQVTALAADRDGLAALGWWERTLTEAQERFESEFGGGCSWTAQRSAVTS